ncbi:unnamed protein product [Brachionus calyciflorus]|uniref:Uncharacterized protein n=1 Tax=Brachionus calyciflorus TaxID=104777 RepID=A0A814NEZ2_9BILA|nr:unnamed protein product [Brachionus calyciflorus]
MGKCRNREAKETELPLDALRLLKDDESNYKNDDRNIGHKVEKSDDELSELSSNDEMEIDDCKDENEEDSLDYEVEEYEYCSIDQEKFEKFLLNRDENEIHLPYFFYSEDEKN